MGASPSKVLSVEIEEMNDDESLNIVQIEDIVSNLFPTLDDDSLSLIQHYRRILEACQRREHILKHATLEYAWSPHLKDYQNTFMDMIVRVPTSSAVPFHNSFPWEVYSFDGLKVRIGMWEDRNNLIYLLGDDVQSWNHVRNIPIGTKLFLDMDIQCKRIRYKEEWIAFM